MGMFLIHFGGSRVNRKSLYCFRSLLAVRLSAGKAVFNNGILRLAHNLKVENLSVKSLRMKDKEPASFQNQEAVKQTLPQFSLLTVLSVYPKAMLNNHLLYNSQVCLTMNNTALGRM